jgi:hypothetical protein
MRYAASPILTFFFRDVDLAKLAEQKFEIDLDSEEGANVTVCIFIVILE